MKNLNAFFLMKYLESKVTLKEISIRISIDTAYLSRIFNNKVHINDRTFLKLCRMFKLDENKLSKDEKHLSELIVAFYDTIYFIETTQRKILFKKITDFTDKVKNTPYIIDIYLVIFVYKTCHNQFDIESERILNLLLKISNSLDSNERQLFYTFYASYQKKYKQNSKQSILYLKKAVEINSNNENLNLLIQYYLIEFLDPKISILEHIKNFDNLFLKCIETNNIKRLINFKIVYSNFLASHNLIREALHNNLDTYDKFYCQQNETFNIKIILNNIAWLYLLLKEYDKAIEYYHKTLQYDEDSDIFFSLAWCYYCLNNNELTNKYIQLGKNTTNNIDIYYLLLEWLEAMTKRKHSKKSYNILCKIVKQYEDILTIDLSYFIQIQKLNYFKFNNFVTEYFDLIRKLLNDSPIGIANLE